VQCSIPTCTENLPDDDAFKVDLQTDPLPDMASQPTKNRERAFRNMMRTISTLWRGQLYNDGLQSPGRKASYIRIAHTGLQRLDLFKPAQFLRIPHNQLPLLRLRTQATNYIPTHLHLSNTHMYTPYGERYCPLCLPLHLPGDETHTVVPFSIVPTSLHPPNPQSIALCSTFDNSTSGHGQLTQTPKSSYGTRSSPTKTG